MAAPSQLSLFDIDNLIRQVEAVSTTDAAQRIIAESDFTEQRRKVIEWMRTENVKVVIAFSGGKDSVAMALYLHFELGIPKDRIELWHHLVDGAPGGKNGWDWPCTDSYCEAFAHHFDLNLLYSYRDGGITREIYRKNETSRDVYFQDAPGGPFQVVRAQQEERFMSTRYKFPAKSKDLKIRWCSAKAKIEVMARAVANTERFQKCNLLICTGERRVESTNRRDYAELEAYNGMTKTRRALVWRPIIDWSDEEVWAIMAKYKVQPHPCYMIGWGRCSCQCCIFNDPDTFASLNQIAPHKISELERIEQEINFTLFPGQSVRQVAEAGTSFITGEMDYWVFQANREFTAPIISENWVLPKGANSLKSCGAN